MLLLSVVQSSSPEKNSRAQKWNFQEKNIFVIPTIQICASWLIEWKAGFHRMNFFFHHALKNCFLLSFVLSLFQQDIKNGVLVFDLVASWSKSFIISSSSFLKWTSENLKSSYSPKFDKIVWKKDIKSFFKFQNAVARPNNSIFGVFANLMNTYPWKYIKLNSKTTHLHPFIRPHF